MTTLRPLLEMARYAVREASRHRLTALGAGVGLLLLGLYAWGLRAALTHLENALPGAAAGAAPGLGRALLVQGFAPLALWLASLVGVALASVLGAAATAGELDSQVALATLARPLPRAAWYLGKALGAALLLTALLGGLLLGLAGLTRAVAGSAPLAWPEASALVLLEGLVTLAVALALGTRLPALAAVVGTLLLYGLSLVGVFLGFVSGLLTQGSRTLENLSTLLMLLFPASGLYARAANLMAGANPLTGLTMGPLGGGAAAPTGALTLWALGYLAAALAAGWALFRSREIG
ncbi:MAG: ABC transporter permease subunit [Clostridia bacterium]|nr:ABC transporter permease subunit [Clostridia bacterium]